MTSNDQLKKTLEELEAKISEMGFEMKKLRLKIIYMSSELNSPFCVSKKKPAHQFVEDEKEYA